MATRIYCAWFPVHVIINCPWYHSADEFEWYDNLDVDEEIENGGTNGDGEWH